MAPSSIILIDSSSDSLTVSWPSMTLDHSSSSSIRYVLQYRNDTHDSKFVTLTDKLTVTQARKRNLSKENNNNNNNQRVGFFFRVTARREQEDFVDASDDVDTRYVWITHQEPFYLLNSIEESRRMDAPTVTLGGSNWALRVDWKAHPEATAAAGYELQMRENEGGVEWITIASCLVGLQVKKKNLTSQHGYQFRIRPTPTAKTPEETTSNKDTIPFSPPSSPVVALGLSQELARFFSSVEEGKLLRQHNQPPVSLEEALGGKEFVLLYASAHWCPPCRYVFIFLFSLGGDNTKSKAILYSLYIFLATSSDDVYIIY